MTRTDALTRVGNGRNGITHIGKPESETRVEARASHSLLARDGPHKPVTVPNESDVCICLDTLMKSKILFIQIRKNLHEQLYEDSENGLETACPHLS